MQNIGNFSGDNLGGLNYIQVAKASEVDSIPSAVNGTVASDIVMKPTKTVYKWILTKESAALQHDAVETDAGVLHRYTVSGIVAKDVAALEQMFNEMKHDRFIVIARNNNLQRKIIGTLAEPCSFKYQHSTQATIAGRNSYTVSFFVETSNPAPFYTGA